MSSGASIGTQAGPALAPAGRARDGSPGSGSGNGCGRHEAVRLTEDTKARDELVRLKILSMDEIATVLGGQDNLIVEQCGFEDVATITHGVGQWKRA